MAIGAAISPTLLTVQVLTLASEHQPRRRAAFLALGSGAVLAAIMVLLATVLRRISLQVENPSSAEIVLKFIAALLLVALGIRALLKKPQDGRSAISRRISKATPGEYFALGAVLMAMNFSSLVLLVPAVHDTVNSSSSSAVILTVLLGVYLAAMLPLLAPLVLTLGANSERLLSGLNTFTTAHSKLINAAIAFFFAALLTWSALR